MSMNLKYTPLSIQLHIYILYSRFTFIACMLCEVIKGHVGFHWGLVKSVCVSDQHWKELQRGGAVRERDGRDILQTRRHSEIWGPQYAEVTSRSFSLSCLLSDNSHNPPQEHWARLFELSLPMSRQVGPQIDRMWRAVVGPATAPRRKPVTFIFGPWTLLCLFSAVTLPNNVYQKTFFFPCS